MKLDQMDKSSKKFWNLAKESNGIDAARSGAAPAAEELASHFATKLSNGKDQEDTGFVPKDDAIVPLYAWKIPQKH